jgi:hypothetical protein
MKFIISEEQQEKLSSYDKVQKMFFKFWDKNGPKADDLLFKFFGFTPMGLEVGGLILRRNDVYRMLRNWYGGDNAKSKAIEILKQKNYTVNSCGGYNFDFEVVHYKTHNDIGEIDVIVKLEIEGGTVDMIMIGGGVETLIDAINNPDYGYEIEGEIADCIYEFLNNKIRNTTGYEIVIEKVILD